MATAVGARRAGIAAVPTAVLFCTVASFWAMNTVAMKVAGRTVPPLSVAAVRAVVGGVVLVAIARRRGADWPRGRGEWIGIVSIAVPMTALSTAFLFLAARNAPAGLVAIMSNTMPLFVAVLAPWLLGEATSLRSTLGLAVGMGGTVLVAWRAIEGDVRPIGIVFGLAAALTAGLGGIMYKRHPLPRLDRTMVVAMQLAVSAALLTVAAIPDDRSSMSFPPTFWLSFAYLSLLGLALSFVLFSELTRRATGLQASAVAYLATVLGVLFGAVLLHERLSWLTLLGGVVTIVGVGIVQYVPSRRS
jgi:O-acetylserine/cysteine efflux transporter